MTVNTLLTDELKGNLGLMQKTLGDFSDADMLVRPTPKANHAAWQLGHLAVFEAMVAGIVAPGKAPVLPADYQEKFGGKNTGNNDPTAFPSKQHLIDLIEKSRAVIADYLLAAPATDFVKPAPEAFRAWVPTMGNLLMALPGHANMHIGQFQVIRRALGKPILF